MRHAIETAPRNGEFVIIVDDASGRFDVAKWLTSREWVRENGEPSEITPSHWSPIASGKHQPYGLESSKAPQDEVTVPVSVPGAVPHPSTGGFFLPHIAPAAAPAIVPPVDAQTATVELERGAQGWRRFATTLAGASVVVALLIGLFFSAESATILTRFPGLQNIFGKQIQQASDAGLRKLGILARQPQVEPNPSEAPFNGRSEAPVLGAQPFSVSNERYNALANELAEARRSLDAINLQLRLETVKAQSFEQQLEREQERTAALTIELAKVRRDFETKMTSLSKASEEAVEFARMQEAMTAALQRSFEEERSRSATLASELTTARRELETRAAQSSNAVEDLAQLGKTTEATTAELRQSLQQEREKVAALARDLESTKRMSGALQSSGPASSGQNGLTRPVAKPAAAEQPAAPAVQGDPEVARLMTRAKALLVRGNIGAARSVLERAVEMGSAEASFALAETYDPRILSSWGTFGTRGDASKARELYAKAMVGGIQEAKDRFDTLGQ
jgi:hypothetical protein